MSNTLLTISTITQEALMVLENELTFASEVNREYDDKFAVSGAKVGNTVNVRLPGRFIGTTGPALNVEDMNENSRAVTLTTQFHVDTQFTTQDLALSLDMFSDRVLKPVIAAVGNRVDRDGLVMATLGSANIVGVAGTPPTGLLTYLQAGAYLDAEGTPRDGRRAVVIEPFTSAAIVDSAKGLFLDEAKLRAQYKKGLMGRDTMGVNWKMDQNVVSQTFGSWATTVGTLTANTSTKTGMTATGWVDSSTITLTNSQTITLQAGDVITLANVFAVNPQNRQAYGSNKLRNFVVQTAVTAAAGTFSVTVSPGIIYGGQFQNVTIPSASATATVTSFSIAGTTATAVVSPQNVLFHRNAFTLACADLELPEGVHFAGRASDKDIGLSLRIVRQYTINNDAIPTRVDVLYGWAPLYREMACRIAA